ncbi:major capsid protein, partial [Vibrio anguillarum]|nr:major capsid protein [Vibrio anguillarum]
MSLSNQAVKFLQLYSVAVAKAAAVEGVDVTNKFSIAPPIETKLRQAI